MQINNKSIRSGYKGPAVGKPSILNDYKKQRSLFNMDANFNTEMSPRVLNVAI